MTSFSRKKTHFRNRSVLRRRARAPEREARSESLRSGIGRCNLPPTRLVISQLPCCCSVDRRLSIHASQYPAEAVEAAAQNTGNRKDCAKLQLASNRKRKVTESKPASLASAALLASLVANQTTLLYYWHTNSISQSVISSTKHNTAMPGPPPPSASYHLQLDSSSDEDSSSDDEIPLSQLKARQEEKVRLQKEREQRQQKQQKRQQQKQSSAEKKEKKGGGANRGGAGAGRGLGLGPKFDKAASDDDDTNAAVGSNNAHSAATAKPAHSTAASASANTEADTTKETEEQRRQRIVEQVRLARLEQQNRHLEQSIRKAEQGSQGSIGQGSSQAASGQAARAGAAGGKEKKTNQKDDIGDGGEALYLSGIERQLDEDDIDQEGNISPSKVKTTPSGGSKNSKKKGAGSGVNDEDEEDAQTSPFTSALAKSSSSASKSNSNTKSLAFSTVQVREYRRAMSTTTVPADGGWPLGLSDDIVRQYSAGTVEEFEHRKQIELRERYVEVYERRRARLEKRKRRDAEEGGGHGGGGRSRSGSKDYGHGGGGGGGGGGNRKRSGSDPGPSAASAAAAPASSAPSAANDDAPPSPRKRSHSFAVGSADVHIHPPPKDVVLETRPFDYKSSAKVLAHHKAVRRASLGDGGGATSGGGDKNDGGTNNEAEITAAILDELDDGKNPLFAIRCEEERIHLILRDAKAGEEFEHAPSSPSRSKDTDKHDKKKTGDSGSAPSPPASPTISRRPRSNSTSDPYHYQPPSPSRKHSSSSASTRRTRSASNASDPHYKPNDIYTHADVMHVRSELEKLRVDRNSDLGCTCRKLHVVLPNQTPTGRKHKHRRLTERKVKEELRKRGLMHGNVLKMKREELEVLLHDTVEKVSAGVVGGSTLYTCTLQSLNIISCNFHCMYVFIGRMLLERQLPMRPQWHWLSGRYVFVLGTGP